MLPKLLPLALQRMAKDYTKGRKDSCPSQNDISATELELPGQMVYLKIVYAQELAQAAKESLASPKTSNWVGTLIHDAILGQMKEDYPAFRVQKRITVNLANKPLTGEPDYFDPAEGLLGDLKTSASYHQLRKVRMTNGACYEPQLNTYAYLLTAIGENVNSLRIDFLYLKDNQVEEFTFHPRLWAAEVTRTYLESNLERISLARHGRYDPCSKEERWDGKRCVEWCPVRDFCPQREQPDLFARTPSGLAPDPAPRHKFNLDERVGF